MQSPKLSACSWPWPWREVITGEPERRLKIIKGRNRCYRKTLRRYFRAHTHSRKYKYQSFVMMSSPDYNHRTIPTSYSTECSKQLVLTIDHLAEHTYFCYPIDQMTMSESQLIRVTVCARRNPKLSEEEFEDHWKNKHGPLIISWLKTYGCVKYVQVHHHLFHSLLYKRCTRSLFPHGWSLIQK